MTPLHPAADALAPPTTGRRNALRRPRWPVVLALLAVLALVAAGGWLWRAQALRPQPAPAAQATRAVAAAPAASAASAPLAFRPDEVVRPQQATLSRQVDFSGALVAPATAVVRSQAAGQLVQLLVADGQRAQAGQLLGRLDQPELPGRLAERQAQRDAAQAALAQAERILAQQDGLAAQRFISAAALDSARAAVDAARAARAQADAALATVRVAADQGRLVAPFAGTVSRLQVQAGEQVAAGQPLLTLVDLRRLELQGLVGTHEVSLLRVGQPVQVQVEGLAKARAARIARIAPAAEPGTRAIGVVVTLDNPDEQLRAGQFATAQVQLSDERPALLLPRAAVQGEAGQAHVWRLDAGRLQRRPVTLGRSDPQHGRVEVLSGVDPADQLLAARFDRLREGQAAQVLPADGARPGGRS